MRTRSYQIITRLDEDEHQYFKKRVKQSGLSQEAYMRHLIKDLIPTDLPPPDYYTMMRTLHGIATNLNQIAQKANVLNVIDAKRYDENAIALRRAIVEITNAVMLPREFK